MRHLLAFFPVTIAFGRPSRAELLILTGALLVLGGGAGWLLQTWRGAAPAPDPSTPVVALSVSSTPSAATILVDGDVRGATPALVDVAPGRHVVALTATDAIPETRQVDMGADGARLDLVLWRARPTVQYLKPTLPGAALVDARFLDDGRVGLVLELPGGEHQAWSLDPAARFATQRLGAIAPRAALAIRPDGQQLAYLLPREPDTSFVAGLAGQGPAAAVWVAPAQDGHDPRQVWALSDGTEDLEDLAWAPDGQHLLLVGRQHPSLGAERTSLRWLDVGTGEASLLALLPSEVAANSAVWSPDGHTVAFVVHSAQLTAVCTLSDAGAFRYLGDLGHDDLAGPPVAPVAWAPDGRLLYGALLRQAPASASGLSAFARPAVSLYLADPFLGLGQPIGGEAGLAPLWRPDGARFAVGLPSGQDSGLRLRALDDDGQAHDVATLDLPTPGATAYGVRWDLARQRALVVTRSAAGQGLAQDFWVLDFSWGVP
jgi:hypothetical protein